MSPVRALTMAALVAVAASLAVAGPGLAGAAGAGNHATAGNASAGTQAPPPTTGGTDWSTPTGGNATAGGNTSAHGNTTADGNTSTHENATSDGTTATNENTTARPQAIERGPVRRPNHRPMGPRIVPDVVVDDDGKAHYHSLSAALEHARGNETILVRPGTYDGPARVDVEGVTIVGFGPEETELVGAGTESAVVVSASDVTVRSVGVDGYRAGVAVEAGEGEVTENVEFENVTIERVSGAGVRIETDGSAARVSNVTVESSELRLGGVVGWSGENGSSAGNSSKAGSKDNTSATGIAVDDGPVTGVAIESRAGAVEDVRLSETTVADLGTGVRLAGSDGAVSGVRVVGSEFEGNDRGIVVSDRAVHSVAVRGTGFLDNRVGLLVREPADASAVTVRGNRFEDNGVGLWSRAAGTLDAEGNAWGAPSGPEAPGDPTGRGDVVRGAVDVDPWRPPALRLEDAEVASGRLSVDLVAHAEQLSAYEVALSYEPASVVAVAVEGGAMPASLEEDRGAVVVSGSKEEAVAGPAVLATVTFEGDVAAVADALEPRGERSVAYDGNGRALGAAFLAGDLSVDVGEEETRVEPPPTETPTAVPGTETPAEVPTTGTELPPTPNGSEQGTGEGMPRGTNAGTPTSTAAGEQATNGGSRTETSTPVGEAERPTDGPDPIGLRSIRRRLAAAGDTLSKLGEFLRSLVG